MVNQEQMSRLSPSLTEFPPGSDNICHICCVSLRKAFVNLFIRCSKNVTNFPAGKGTTFLFPFFRKSPIRLHSAGQNKLSYTCF